MAFKEILFRVEDGPEGGYAACAIGYPLATTAATWQELKDRAREAVAAYFDPAEKPKLINLHFVRDEVVAVRLGPEGVAAQDGGPRRGELPVPPAIIPGPATGS